MGRSGIEEVTCEMLLFLISGRWVGVNVSTGALYSKRQSVVNPTIVNPNPNHVTNPNHVLNPNHVPNP